MVDELRCPELYEYYPKEELTTFTAPTDFIAKALFYLNNTFERKAKAKLAYDRTLAQHTYDMRILELVKYMP